MVEIPLTKGKIALIDDEDYEKVNKHRWHYFIKDNRTTGYAYTNITINGKHFCMGMHRFILNLSDCLHIDHVNSNGLDNRKENLRVCSRSQNRANSILNKNNSSGFRGVYISLGKWVASIRVNNKSIYLGTYQDKINAAIAYNNAAMKHFREFAKINSIERG